ncbi:hypothetical protein [Mycobacterium tuberculosis]|uniref:hypothetical protein n=1 Tax=Mycobacterium tuberculosis TaxID=1773 RepID=UPI00272A48A0|nr:hypothetical protein [Mycobacterium tuberculosis]
MAGGGWRRVLGGPNRWTVTATANAGPPRGVPLPNGDSSGTPATTSRATRTSSWPAAAALAPAERRRIHTFIATSPLHMEVKLRMTPDQVLEQAVKAVKLALQYTDDVEFSLAPAERRRIHTFIATSPLHMEVKLRMTPDQVLVPVMLSIQRCD